MRETENATKQASYELQQIMRIGESLGELKAITSAIQKDTAKIAAVEENINRVSLVANEANDRASSAHKRLDGLFKFILPISLFVITAILGAILNLILK